MSDIKEYLKQTKTVLLTQDAFDELMQRAYAQPEIIRCKECKEFRRYIDTDITFCDRTECERKPDDFCSMAERRTDG